MVDIKRDGYEAPGAPSPSKTQGDARFRDLARNAYKDSTSWFEHDLYRQWERNLANFHSRHAAGSKYLTAAYQHRSRLFRPKTRAAVRRSEAAAAVAFFATSDVVVIRPENEGDPRHRLAASVRQELLNYRLNAGPERGINWFMTLIGAFQCAQVMGAVCSRQTWAFEEQTYEELEPLVDELGRPVIEHDTGRPATRTVTRRKIVKDRPEVELAPLENIRFAPTANWIDPVNSSPYFIELVPMHVHEVVERMRAAPSQREPAWWEYSEGDIASARQDRFSSVRQAREAPHRTDRMTKPVSVTDWDIVWVHRVCLRYRGEDWFFYTLGEDLLLSEPMPVREVFVQGRPYVLGVTVPEVFRPLPSAKVQLGQDLQAQANEIVNSRIDNVRLAMNHRYFVNRTGNVDIRALMRSAPGSVTTMNDPQADAKLVETRDVTASAYNEQDRLNIDLDEILGTFSAGSVQSNRKLNETVGGLNLISSEANSLQDYELIVFGRTWVEPVLRQIDALEQDYETDELVLSVVGQKSREWRQLNAEYGGRLQLTPDAFADYPVEVRVNAGFGSTNPIQRVERLNLALDAVAKFAPQSMQRVKVDAIIAEVFGAVGHQDGSRFFDGLDGDADPQVENLRSQVQQLQQVIEQELHKEQARGRVQMELERAKAQAQAFMKRLELESAKEDRVTERSDNAAERALKLQLARLQGGYHDRDSRRRHAAAMRSQTSREAAEGKRMQLDDRRFSREVEIADRDTVDLSRALQTIEQRLGVSMSQLRRDLAAEVARAMDASAATSAQRLNDITERLAAVTDVFESDRERTDDLAKAIAGIQSQRERTMELVTNFLAKHGSPRGKEIGAQLRRL